MDELYRRCKDTFRALRGPALSHEDWNVMFQLNRAACADFADALRVTPASVRDVWETRFMETD